MNGILVTGGLLGLASVIIGAAGAHVDGLSAGSFDTALRYHQMHAIIIVVLGLTRLAPRPPRMALLVDLAAWTLFAGTVMFSGTIYLAAWFALPWITALTPFGGIGLLVGWALLVAAGLLQSNR